MRNALLATVVILGVGAVAPRGLRAQGGCEDCPSCFLVQHKNDPGVPVETGYASVHHYCAGISQSCDGFHPTCVGFGLPPRELQQAVIAAIGRPQQLLDLLEASWERIVLNTRRQALQIVSCAGDAVVAHVPLRAEEFAFLQARTVLALR